MDNLVIYFILFASICNTDAWSINLDHESLKEVGVKNRIVEGSETTIEKHPYQAYLRASDSRTACSGAIVSSHHIVTSALCVDKADSINVRVGSTNKNENGHLYTTKTYMVHPMYLAGENDYDVAIVLIQDGMPLDGKTVGTIDLVPLNYNARSGDGMIISGWGDYGPKAGYDTANLKEAYLSVTSKFDCDNKMTPRLFCLLNKRDFHRPCKGDMGDPAVDEDGLLAGVISVFLPCKKDVAQPATRFGDPQINSFIISMTTPKK